jgi:23S rRNA (cytidine1920-2'-O)/16S rRNA (cytidine1409-2'-O)-methyltransferase
VLAGIVFSGERRVDKAGDTLVLDAPLEVRGSDHPYVSRGGVKLAGAIQFFELDVAGWTCADFGASTGGFTDCLLQRGARQVHAIDVGRGQLHARLRVDPRVVVRERTNARHLRSGELGGEIDLVVIDASFIGLGKLLPAASAVVRAGGFVLAMIKPQFEVDRRDLRKGVVRDPGARLAALSKVEGEALALGLEHLGRCDSQLAGPDGNLEAFILLRRPD